MDFLRNLLINIKATGPAAVLIVWIIGFTVIATSDAPNAKTAQMGMFMFGIVLLGMLGGRQD
jgi:hypothetical protein